MRFPHQDDEKNARVQRHRGDQERARASATLPHTPTSDGCGKAEVAVAVAAMQSQLDAQLVLSRMLTESLTGMLAQAGTQRAVLESALFASPGRSADDSGAPRLTASSAASRDHDASGGHTAKRQLSSADVISPRVSLQQDGTECKRQHLLPGAYGKTLEEPTNMAPRVRPSTTSTLQNPPAPQPNSIAQKADLQRQSELPSASLDPRLLSSALETGHASQAHITAAHEGICNRGGRGDQGDAARPCPAAWPFAQPFGSTNLPVMSPGIRCPLPRPLSPSPGCTNWANVCALEPAPACMGQMPTAARRAALSSTATRADGVSSGRSTAFTSWPTCPPAGAGVYGTTGLLMPYFSEGTLRQSRLQAPLAGPRAASAAASVAFSPPPSQPVPGGFADGDHANGPDRLTLNASCSGFPAAVYQTSDGGGVHDVVGLQPPPLPVYRQQVMSASQPTTPLQQQPLQRAGFSSDLLARGLPGSQLGVPSLPYQYWQQRQREQQHRSRHQLQPDQFQRYCLMSKEQQ